MNKVENVFYLRLVEPKDIDLLFTWANDKEVRNNAFNTKPILFEEHKKWFSKLINDTNQVQYIFMKDDIPIGQIRFTIEDEKAYIDYSIAPEMRGKGYGKNMLSLACKIISDHFHSVKVLVGQVKKGNIASEKCFEDCGYNEVFKQFELKL